MSHILGPFTNEILDGLLNEFKKKEIKDKILNLSTPLIDELFSKYKNYIVGFILIQILIIILLLIIIIMIVNKY